MVKTPTRSIHTPILHEAHSAVSYRPRILIHVLCRSARQSQEQKARKAAKQERRAAGQAAGRTKDERPVETSQNPAAQEDPSSTHATAVAATENRPCRAAHTNEQPTSLPALSAVESQPDAALAYAPAAVMAEQLTNATGAVSSTSHAASAGGTVDQHVDQSSGKASAEGQQDAQSPTEPEKKRQR